MGLGDCVAGILAATGNFQPAAGVEVLITGFSLGQNAADKFSFYDGTDTSDIVAGTSGAATVWRPAITNSIYLRYTKNTGNGGYGGIQTK